MTEINNTEKLNNENIDLTLDEFVELISNLLEIEDEDLNNL